MTILEIILVALALSMDAFAVSICKGLSMKKYKFKNSLVIGLYFGLFQALMPILGYFLASSFKSIVERFDHWIAFILLFLIGLNMIKESFSQNVIEKSDKLDFKSMFILSLATSIDALAVGISFAFLKTNIMISSLVIGIITFILSIIGVIIGNRFGNKFQNEAELIGGIILIIIGLKILLEHLNIISF